MSIATIGAVAATDTELLIPGIPQIPYALLLTGAGGTTEVIEVRSLQHGGHVYVTRGAFGSLAVAHTAPVVVTLYDPNSGGGSGGSVTVTGSQGGSVAASSIAMPGLVADLGSGVAGVGLIFSVLGPFTVNWNDVEGGPIAEGWNKYLVDLTAGTIVLGVFTVTRTTWIDSPATPSGTAIAVANIGLVPGNNKNTGPQRILNTLLLEAETSTAFADIGYGLGGGFGGTLGDAYPLSEAAILKQNCTLVLAYEVNLNNALAAGVTDVYAIIATPAS